MCTHAHAYILCTYTHAHARARLDPDMLSMYARVHFIIVSRPFLDTSQDRVRRRTTYLPSSRSPSSEHVTFISGVRISGTLFARAAPRIRSRLRDLINNINRVDALRARKERRYLRRALYNHVYRTVEGNSKLERRRRWVFAASRVTRYLCNIARAIVSFLRILRSRKRTVNFFQIMKARTIES